MDFNNKFGRFVLSLFTVIALCSMTLLAYNSVITNKEVSQLREANQLILKQNTENNKKQILLKLIDSKFGTKLPIAQKVKLCDTIYNVSQIRQVPLDTVCAVIEQESGWNPNVTSPVNAKGLMQIMPSTAKPYLMIDKIPYNSDILYDPVINVTIGISYLADLHEGHIESGKSQRGDFTYALHSYNAGPTATAQIYSQKFDATYQGSVNSKAKKYASIGL